MKKITAVLLCAALFIAVCVPVVCAYSGSANVLPIISVEGRSKTNPIYSSDGKQIFPVEYKDDAILESVKECLPSLGKALITGNYEPWAEKVYECIAPYYEGLIFDGNGEMIDKGSRVVFEYNESKPARYNHNSLDYRFQYDWRMDPMGVADDLAKYIDCVLGATGQKKVSLTGRCYGANIIAAYLYKYGCEKIDTVVFYAQIATGSFMAEMTFAGKFALDTAAVEAYLRNGGKSLTGDTLIDTFLTETVAYLNTFKGLDAPADLAKLIVDKIYPAVAPKVLPATYATFPSMWSMISDDNYETAKSVIFNGQRDKYAGLIEKTDNYHYNVQVKLVDILNECRQKGMNVGVITKYNTPNPPIYENSIENGDNVVMVNKASFGATAANYGEVLSSEYLAKADEKYISSDHIIDAGTAAFKDYSWFIKDNPHSSFPKCIDTLIRAICNFDGQMTVNDNAEYPQFMKYDAETKTISPLTDEPANDREKPIKDHFNKLIAMLKAFFALVKSLFVK